MKEQMKTMAPLLCAALMLSACGSTGGGQKSEGSTHTLTGGAEAAPTSEATPQPAQPRGTMGGGASGITGGSAPGSSGAMGGDATTGGAEAAPTTEGTSPKPKGGGLYDAPGGMQAPPRR